MKQAIAAWVFSCSLVCPTNPPRGITYSQDAVTGKVLECHDGECRAIPHQMAVECHGKRYHRRKGHTYEGDCR
jgi:hypothetical protein